MGGISEKEGRLEVCFDQRWGTINGNGWTHTDTQVACRQLGYSTSGMQKYTEGYIAVPKIIEKGSKNISIKC